MNNIDKPVEELADPTDLAQVVTTPNEDVDMLGPSVQANEPSASKGLSALTVAAFLNNSQIPQAEKDIFITMLQAKGSSRKSTNGVPKQKTIADIRESLKSLDSVDGEAENKVNMDTWAKRIRQKVGKVQLQGQDAVDLLGDLLKGPTSNWFADKIGNVPNYEDNDFDFFVDMIVDKYRSKDHPIDKMERIKNHRIQTPEDVFKFEQYVSALGEGFFTDDAVKYLFISCLPGDLKLYAKLNVPSSADAAYSWTLPHLKTRKVEKRPRPESSYQVKKKTKFNKINKRCSHCGKLGHENSNCWTLHSKSAQNRSSDKGNQ
ncbi:uncharacterized protein NDAI_0J00820 [Naumovozyma dairenensis CBS 421]|uniref:CCHC-type domain-containing protein n=1 Tax=Naumovozyma dairenensis (strain ATCC 10597 / BCRC 20456 / CBS 421 / NBRC 0211 / NRRL Y-12639) TaxID=1071378 RepID=G0WGP6_NAUDC|nr:hypothetical protein NDAI_0J00820 [Naumovozyma dairenensis CBS 421]CCD26974.1 hypothetical protein NDAI_0J00820 [Naumovozyma dairenensis CBS 421]